MKTDNDKLVEQAARFGSMVPLLTKLKSGTVKMSGSRATSENDRGDPPSDTLWYTVLDAHGEGELSDAQFEQCLAAVREGAAKSA